VLQALPVAVPETGWNIPAWRVGDLLIVEPGMGQYCPDSELV